MYETEKDGELWKKKGNNKDKDGDDLHHFNQRRMKRKGKKKKSWRCCRQKEIVES